MRYLAAWYDTHRETMRERRECRRKSPAFLFKRNGER